MSLPIRVIDTGDNESAGIVGVFGGPPCGLGTFNVGNAPVGPLTCDRVLSSSPTDYAQQQGNYHQADQPRQARRPPIKLRGSPPLGGFGCFVGTRHGSLLPSINRV
jgi:hypothetical protein